MSNSKKKLKKKMRHQMSGEGVLPVGSAPKMPAPLSQIGQMMAQLQTVKGDGVAQPIAPNLPTALVQPSAEMQVSASGELPQGEEEEEENTWADDEDANDGGGIPISREPNVQVNAPLVQEMREPLEIALPEKSAPIEMYAPAIAAPQNEAEYAKAAESVTLVSERRDVYLVEGDNATGVLAAIHKSNVTQPEVDQENDMQRVNHPDVVAAATPAPITTAGSGIVAESAMERMQTEAHATPPTANESSAQQSSNDPSGATIEKKKPVAAFHNIQITAMFTLDLTNFDLMTGLKNSLSRVRLGSEELNLYSPFRKAGKKTETKPAAEGVLRHAMSGMLDLSDAINNSRVMVVGNDDDIQAHIGKAIGITKSNIENLFPAKPEEVVASFLDEDELATIQLQFSDFVNVRSWTNSSAALSEGDDVPFEIHNAVINTTVNAGMLYDTEERVKEIHRIIKTIELFVAKREEANTTIVLAIALDASLLGDAAMREMLDTLLSEEDFSIYSRQELLRLDDNDFLPQTRESVENDLLLPKSDIILMRILTQEEDDEEEGEEDVAAAPVADDAEEVE